MGDQLLLGPAYGIARLLKRTGLTKDDIDVWEIHEAFAGQVLANLESLKDDKFCREYMNVMARWVKFRWTNSTTGADPSPWDIRLVRPELDLFPTPPTGLSMKTGNTPSLPLAPLVATHSPVLSSVIRITRGNY